MPNQPLGRGLGSLIPSRPYTTPPPPVAPIAPRPAMPVRRAVEPPIELTSSKRIYDIPVNIVDPNPHQPRHRVQDEALQDLVDSIKQHGILQPLIVTKEGERYQLIAGERRLRAAQQLGLPSVPAIIREARELEQLELAIVENVQRENLNPVEEANAYQQLSEEFGLTQEDIARKVGKSRATVANALRILSLPTEMQQALRESKISGSHAKILLTAITPAERQQLFKKIMDQSLPVRAAAQLGRTTTVRRYTRRQVDPAVRAAEDELRARFGTKVTITKRDHRGTISIEFYSDEEYHNLLSRLQ